MAMDWAAQHRALVRSIIASEGEAAADLRALESIRRLEALLQFLPLTAVALQAAREWAYEAREAIERHL